jgi:type IX secretion system PorP/SprF family membrane protein
MKGILRVIFIVGSFLISMEMKAQDPHFTQFYANPLYLNPAFAGTAFCPRFVVNFRDQWPGLSGTYVTYAASYDQNIDAISGGIGFSVLHDRAGRSTLNTSNINAMYSYHYAVNRHFSVRAALQASFFQKSLDWSKLTFGDQIDARYGFIYETQEQQVNSQKSGIDFSAGLLAYSKKFFGGFAVHHLTEPEEGIIGAGSKLPRKYTAHVGAMIPLTRNLKDASISPNILFKQQATFSQLNLGMYFTKGPFVGGIWYRNKDAFMFLVGLEQSKPKGPKFRVGYSYDVTTSKLNINASKGSHEVSLSYVFPCRKKKPKWRTISCPSF